MGFFGASWLLGARKCRSGPPGAAWALESATQARSAPPGRSKVPLGPAGRRQGRSKVALSPARQRQGRSKMLLRLAWRHQKRSKVMLRPAWRHQGRSKVPLGLAQSRLGRVITRDQDRMHVRCCIRRCLLLEDARHVFTSLCITWLHSLCNVHGDAQVRTSIFFDEGVNV